MVVSMGGGKCQYTLGLGGREKHIRSKRFNACALFFLRKIKKFTSFKFFIYDKF